MKIVQIVSYELGGMVGLGDDGVVYLRNREGSRYHHTAPVRLEDHWGEWIPVRDRAIAEQSFALHWGEPFVEEADPHA